MRDSLRANMVNVHLWKADGEWIVRVVNFHFDASHTNEALTILCFHTVPMHGMPLEYMPHIICT